MIIRKQVLDRMERCYAASSLTIDGQLHVVLASEAEGGPCYAYSGENFTQKETIWEDSGGTMSLLQIPGSNGEFLAVQGFFPGFRAEGAKLVWGKRDDRLGWIVKDLAALPFLHRFDMFRVEDEIFILASTLCSSKKNREDWSDPGKIYIGKLPASPEEGVTFTPILENLYKNHGFCRGQWDGMDAGFVTCDCGVYVLLPPKEKGGKWGATRLLDRAVGDIAVCDLDGDCVDELITIEPFHGDRVLINKRILREYHVAYCYSEGVVFAHAITACKLRGKPSVVCGARRGKAELFILQPGDSEKVCGGVSVVDEGVGPSNVIVINQPDRDIIVSANHSQDEAALYYVMD